MLYIESRIVDDGEYNENLPDPKMREGNEYPTRLKDGGELQYHDDYSCLEDFVEAGYLIEKEGVYTMAPLGWVAAMELRRAKAEKRQAVWPTETWDCVGMRKALEAISEPAAAYSKDQLKFAQNTIEFCINTAKEALCQ